MNDGTLFAIRKQNGEEYFSFEQVTLVGEMLVPEKAADLRVFICWAAH